MSGDATMKAAPGWRRPWTRTSIVIGAALTSFMGKDAWAVAAAPTAKLVNVADTRAMAPGPGRWIADLYNSDYWLYGLVVVITMAAMGLILGMGFDRLMSLIGINLGRLEHQE